MPKDDVKILLLDIETIPDLVWVWSLYDDNAIEVKEHWKIISFAASWYGSRKVLCKALPDYSNDEEALCQDIWNLLDDADIVVAHNGDRFDIRRINARLIDHGFDPPSPYKTVDTKKEISRVAAFSSNRLDWLAKQLHLGRKVEHNGWPLWRGCIEGDKKAWALMKKYNAHDITIMRNLYERLSPWMRQPNVGLYKSGLRCTSPTCGSKNIQQRGYYYARTRIYKKYVCKDCGKWSRSVHADTSRNASMTEAG